MGILYLACHVGINWNLEDGYRVDGVVYDFCECGHGN